ncbi:porin [Roseibium sp. RKSG952]|uniref:porin n=1 Tax=Roseibium sp. RKSG952 TaxID=2529384 RepID=UPI0018AD211C|nr:porin [Roseibium sp. RKSG952]
MKFTRLALAASALTITVAAPAMATDIPAPSAPDIPSAPAAYVEVCAEYGPGFFKIPGTDTCLGTDGRIRASVFNENSDDEVNASIDARIGLEARTATEYGMLRAYVRSEVEADNTEKHDAEFDRAFISLGPATVGFNETLFNTNVLYGDATGIAGLDDSQLAIDDALQISVLHTGFGPGYYAGLSLEASDRDKFGASFDRDNLPDIIGRVGVTQGWGTVDLSTMYSDTSEAWAIKGTGEIAVIENVDARATVGYFDAADETFLLSLAAGYHFTPTVNGYVGGVYNANNDIDDIYGGNVGLVYSPLANLDLQGEVGYQDDGNDDDWNTMFRVSTTW